LFVPGYMQVPKCLAYTDVYIRDPSSQPSRHMPQSRDHTARHCHSYTAADSPAHTGL